MKQNWKLIYLLLINGMLFAQEQVAVESLDQAGGKVVYIRHYDNQGQVTRPDERGSLAFSGTSGISKQGTVYLRHYDSSGNLVSIDEIGNINLKPLATPPPFLPGFTRKANAPIPTEQKPLESLQALDFIKAGAVDGSPLKTQISCTSTNKELNPDCLEFWLASDTIDAYCEGVLKEVGKRATSTVEKAKGQ